jgi:hypothetical protein
VVWARRACSAGVPTGSFLRIPESLIQKVTYIVGDFNNPRRLPNTSKVEEGRKILKTPRISGVGSSDPASGLFLPASRCAQNDRSFLIDSSFFGTFHAPHLTTAPNPAKKLQHSP